MSTNISNRNTSVINHQNPQNKSRIIHRNIENPLKIYSRALLIVRPISKAVKRRRKESCALHQDQL